MNKLFLYVFFLCCSISLQAQNTISGYMNFHNSEEWQQQVFLTKIYLGDEADAKLEDITANIDKDGYFAFPKSVFTEQDEVYKLQVKKNVEYREKGIDTVLNSFRFFIISNKDILFFPEGEELFSNYVTSNEADKEWKKLKNHENNLAGNNFIDEYQYREEVRNYSKDSLQILLVKLLSTKTLADKDLLEKDIKENAEYYLDFLSRLQASDLDPSSYAYLESTINEVNQDIIIRKYHTSLVLNGIGFLIISGLVILVFRLRKREKVTPSIPLSNQEKNVKKLILQGKSNKEIASELFISISTVKTHITNIYSKLNVSTRKDLLLKS